MEIIKQILVDAIVGCGFKSMSFACEMESKRLARFSGNQWNDDWEWRRDALENMDVETLTKIYELAKRK